MKTQIHFEHQSLIQEELIRKIEKI